MVKILLGCLSGLRVDIYRFASGWTEMTLKDLKRLCGSCSSIVSREESMEAFASGPKVDVFMAKLLFKKLL